jgi:glycogen synthase
VVANDGVGDVAKIVSENRVGVLVQGNTPEQMAEAYAALQELMRDPELAQRCRATADAVFSLKAGTERYRALYRSILNANHV